MKFHFYRIKINSKHIYRLLNCCRNNEIRDVEIDKDYAGFSINYNQYSDLEKILKENNIEIVNRQELGIYTKITNFQFIKSVIYIFAIFILLLIANSAFIWKITIKGNYSYTAEQMIDYVHEKGVKEGVLKESIDTESLEKSIRKNFDDISWVCVEVKGTNLIIHIKENYITEISVKEDKPYDLVAECDCTIVSALVRRGKLNVNPKEKVKKGQVLITGVVDVTDESGQLLFNEYCNADGEIIGQIKEKYEEKKRRIAANVEKLKQMEPRAAITCEMEDTYGNIADAITDDNHKAIDYIFDAFKELDIQPKPIAMRGGTDGSFISTKGILTPNYFTGGLNFHSRYEFLPLPSLEKSYEVTMKLIDLIYKG